MKKTYNLSSKSDVRRFSKDLKKLVLDNVREQALKQSVEIVCPHCKTEFSAYNGRNICPFCKQVIDLTMNLDF